MIILGIDPGTTRAGFGIIKASKKNISSVAYGCMGNSKEEIASQRLKLIYNQTVALIKKHKPSVLAIERLFFNRNAKTVIAVSQASGVIMLAAAKAKIPVFEYMPLQIKFVIDGYGRAKKKAIQKRVVEILKLKETPKPDDAADALAVAICHCRKIYGKLKKVHPKLVKGKGGEKCGR